MVFLSQQFLQMVKQGHKLYSVTHSAYLMYTNDTRDSLSSEIYLNYFFSKKQKRFGDIPNKVLKRL